MRVAAATALLLTALAAGRADAAAVTAGTPEHLVTTGGECVRLFHSGGDVGCRSLSSAEMAPLFPISSGDELSAFMAGAANHQDPDESYTLVLPEELLSSDLLQQGGGGGGGGSGSSSSRISGAFAFPRAGGNVSFDVATPQGKDTVDGALNPFASEGVAWNPNGVGLMAQSLPFSVVLLQDAATGAEFMTRARRNAESGAGATYKAFMNYYMGPKNMTSVKCLAFTNIDGDRSPKCDPIGGQSSWAVRGDTTSSEIVLAMTSMDSNGLSHVLAPGANTGASGVVALLAAANALRALEDSAFDKKLVFAAFQAEKFGFVGSRKLLSDLANYAADPTGACAYPVSGSQSPYGSSFCTNPMQSSTAFAAQLALANISAAIAVDQVGILPESGNFSVHLNPNANDTSDLLAAFVDAPSANGQVARSSVTKALPPTPLLSFVNDGEYGKSDLVSAVLAGYDDTFSGQGTYNSRHDVLDAVDADAVTQAAQVLAEALYTLAAANATSANMAKIEVNATLVSDMLSCISTDWTCDLMKAYSKPMLSTMITYLDLSKSSYPSYTKPVTLYSSVLDSDRSMLLMKDSSYYSLFNGTFADDTYRVRLFPNAYEVFTRAFLASSAISSTAASAATTCSQSQSCGDSGKGKECVYPGVCADQRAFYHEASDPGLKRTTTALLYDVVNASKPLWVEPKWSSDIGSYSFPDPGVWIGWITLAIGVVVTIASVALSKMLLESVHKMKLM